MPARSSWKSGAAIAGTGSKRVQSRGPRPPERELTLQRVSLLEHLLNQPRSSDAGEELAFQPQPGQHLAVCQKQVLYRRDLLDAGYPQHAFRLDRNQRVGKQPGAANSAGVKIGHRTELSVPIGEGDELAQMSGNAIRELLQMWVAQIARGCRNEGRRAHRAQVFILALGGNAPGSEDLDQQRSEIFLL